MPASDKIGTGIFFNFMIDCNQILAGATKDVLDPTKMRFCLLRRKSSGELKRMNEIVWDWIM
jgi:hypothetical protein